MKTTIETNSYSFLIILQKNEEDYSFEIMAICKGDKMKSTITSLNFIISELLESLIIYEDLETTIYTDRDTGKKSTKKQLDYLMIMNG